MDFGDVIFFMVFVIIIISNIMKHLKKIEKQTPGNKKSETPSEAPPGKKSGWKNVLEQMLEEARKQMENVAEPESAGSPLKHPTGWEDIISEKDPVKQVPGESSERANVSRPPVIYDDSIRENAKFWPECMRCNDPMKAITDLGTGKQSGLIYCDSCGEQHQYQILNGELKLKQTETTRKKSEITPERRYWKVEEKRSVHGKMTTAMPPDAALAARKIRARKIRAGEIRAGEIKIPHQLSREGLRSAVVWSEILGKPLGLRDLEI